MSGRCIPHSWVCDIDRDCGPDDDSDEHSSCGESWVANVYASVVNLKLWSVAHFSCFLDSQFEFFASLLAQVIIIVYELPSKESLIRESG